LKSHFASPFSPGLAPDSSSSTKPPPPPPPPLEPTADVQGPFTPALGLQIARKNFPYIEGTGGLYFREASDNDCVLLLTARHVALPTSKHFNDTYDRKNNSTPRLDVIHLGDQAYQNAAEAIASKIGREADVIKHYKGIVGRPEEAGEGEDARTTTRRQRIKGERRARAEESKASLEQLKEIAKSWLALSERARSRTRSLRPSDFRQYR
jgi:hypothetical protein